MHILPSLLNHYSDQLTIWDDLKIIEEIELPERKTAVSGMPDRFGSPFGLAGRPMRGPRAFLRGEDRSGPGAGMFRRFEFLMNGEPLLLVEWTHIP